MEEACVESLLGEDEMWPKRDSLALPGGPFSISDGVFFVILTFTWSLSTISSSNSQLLLRPIEYELFSN